MSEEVLINVGVGETRVAVVVDRRLDQIVLERARSTSERGRVGQTLLGNVYLGRVQRVLPGMQAAFVEVGLSRAGFLGAREARCLADLPGFNEDALPPINKVVHEGQEILVQVVKDPIGEKGARLSANVTLPGRLLVFVPYQRGVALSRRIVEEGERERLINLTEDTLEKQGLGNGAGGGYIVRTAAIGASEEELAEDADRILDQWRQISRQRQRVAPPFLLYQDIDPVSRSLRDYVDLTTNRVLIDDRAAFADAQRYCREMMPQLHDRLELFRGPGQLFDLYNVEEEIEACLSPTVPLPNGGHLVIETTEALTSIDVNSGSYTEATGLEETSACTNLDAAREICRQLKLRGIGGLIVVDFIHMNEQENIDKVIEALNEGLADDRVPTQISDMTEFGLVALTRKRVREPLARFVSESCERCHGSGRVKTIVTVANEILRKVERKADAHRGRAIRVQASAEMADWLEAQRDELLVTLEKRIGAVVRVATEPEYARDRYDIVVE